MSFSWRLSTSSLESLRYVLFLFRQCLSFSTIFVVFFLSDFYVSPLTVCSDSFHTFLFLNFYDVSYTFSGVYILTVGSSTLVSFVLVYWEVSIDFFKKDFSTIRNGTYDFLVIQVGFFLNYFLLQFCIRLLTFTSVYSCSHGCKFEGLWRIFGMSSCSSRSFSWILYTDVVLGLCPLWRCTFGPLFLGSGPSLDPVSDLTTSFRVVLDVSLCPSGPLRYTTSLGLLWLLLSSGRKSSSGVWFTLEGSCSDPGLPSIETVVVPDFPSQPFMCLVLRSTGISWRRPFTFPFTDLFIIWNPHRRIPLPFLQFCTNSQDDLVLGCRVF